MKVRIVIGASYGDEGKGLMTDAICAGFAGEGLRCLNVLSNGGAQRGHTVVTPEGLRHVFHHLGSGTFAGADTFLPETYIVNPMLYRPERQALREAGYAPRVLCHRRARWSTPFDMIVNQIAEESRGAARHGSCGAGIWETVLRWRRTPVPSLFEFAGKRERLTAWLRELRDAYVPERLGEIGIRDVPSSWRGILEDDGMIEAFADDAEAFLCDVRPVNEAIPSGWDAIVFENGQGLLLDMDRREFGDHTTPSHTGAADPAALLKAAGIGPGADIAAYYVTRTYLTRHGAGPFEGECPREEIAAGLTDLTNVPNPYQGAIRYGRIDLGALAGRIRADAAGLDGLGAPVRRCLAVTHMNVTGGRFAVCREGDTLPEGEFDAILVSDGETRDSIRACIQNRREQP